jgi:Tfp pilus assembly protein FimT
MMRQEIEQFNGRIRMPPSRPAPSFHASRFTFHAPRLTPAFTLIELILVMAILTMTVSLMAPTLSHFFRGRTLDSEARRLLALTRHGQTRAASEGVPMDLWVNAPEGQFGLEAEPSYETTDAKAVTFSVDSGVQLEVVNGGAAPAKTQTQSQPAVATDSSSVLKVTLSHPGLPTIRFLPDGSISENSPKMLRLTGREGASLWVAQSLDRLSYEIRDTDK